MVPIHRAALELLESPLLGETRTVHGTGTCTGNSVSKHRMIVGRQVGNFERKFMVDAEVACEKRRLLRYGSYDKNGIVYGRSYYRIFLGSTTI
jgi:hypothetical protein